MFKDVTLGIFAGLSFAFAGYQVWVYRKNRKAINRLADWYNQPEPGSYPIIDIDWDGLIDELNEKHRKFRESL